MPSFVIGNQSYVVNRLIEIFSKAEERWIYNLNFRLGNIKVKYLLISEAPPWSENGQVNYFYNNFQGNWCKSIYRAFYPNEVIPNDSNTALTNLTHKGFLLVDSLPLSINYSNQRNNEFYDKLLKSSMDWWLGKLENPGIVWDENVKVALAFKVNGRKIIEKLNYILKLPDGQEINLSEENIAANASGYTDSMKLKEIFGL